MSETAYYILLSLVEPRYGYGIMQHVLELTGGRLTLGPGTLYGSLSRMEKDGLIRLAAADDKRKTYRITDEGKTILLREASRITELYLNAKEALEQ